MAPICRRHSSAERIGTHMRVQSREAQMSRRDLEEEKQSIIQWLFAVGRGTVEFTSDQMLAVIHRLGTVRKLLGEKT